jgi:release factor glutamine methyltransferase
MADALQVARKNAQHNHLANVELLQGDWYAPVAGQQFDLIVSNPPYVAADDPHLSRGDLPHEPEAALVGRGVTGLDDLGEIVTLAPNHLMPGGWLLVEHGADQAAALKQMLTAAGFMDVTCWQDLAGLDRTSGGRLPNR